MRITAGQYKGRSLKSTTGPGFRPAMGIVREALFSMLEARGIDYPACRVLDIFAGSGSLGFEALSRGASAVCFVESAPYAVKVIKANAELLSIAEDRISIQQEQAAKLLSRKSRQPYSLVFIDPPYELNALGSTLKYLLANNWLAQEALINAEVHYRSKVLPEEIHPQLNLLADRTYGQTRVILWNVKHI